MAMSRYRLADAAEWLLLGESGLVSCLPREPVV